MDGIGKLLIIIGVVLLIAGGAFSVGYRGLPGDILIRKDNSVFFFPLATSIVLSIVISIILYILSR